MNRHANDIDPLKQVFRKYRLTLLLLACWLLLLIGLYHDLQDFIGYDLLFLAMTILVFAQTTLHLKDKGRLNPAFYVFGWMAGLWPIVISLNSPDRLLNAERDGLHLSLTLVAGFNLALIQHFASQRLKPAYAIAITSMAFCLMTWGYMCLKEIIRL